MKLKRYKFQKRCRYCGTSIMWDEDDQYIQIEEQMGILAWIIPAKRYFVCPVCGYWEEIGK